SPTFGRFTSDTSGWLLVDKERYSLDGSECSKVGTSFSAFRFEPDRCQRSVGSCLSNQLLDFAQEDAQRVAQGLDPIHALSSLGPISTLESPNGSLSIALVVTQRLNSLITLEIAADDVTFIKNRSPGRIVSVAAPLFEAMSSEGRVDIRIANSGSLDSDFTLTVCSHIRRYQCTAHICVESKRAGMLPKNAPCPMCCAPCTMHHISFPPPPLSLPEWSCIAPSHRLLTWRRSPLPPMPRHRTAVSEPCRKLAAFYRATPAIASLPSPLARGLPGSHVLTLCLLGAKTRHRNHHFRSLRCSRWLLYRVMSWENILDSSPPPICPFPQLSSPWLSSITPVCSSPPRPRPHLFSPALHSQGPLLELVSLVNPLYAATLTHPPSPLPLPPAHITLALFHRSGMLLPALALLFSLLQSLNMLLFPLLPLCVPPPLPPALITLALLYRSGVLLPALALPFTPHLMFPPHFPQLSSPWPCFIAPVCSSQPSPFPSPSCTPLSRPSPLLPPPPPLFSPRIPLLLGKGGRKGMGNMACIGAESACVDVDALFSSCWEQNDSLTRLVCSMIATPRLAVFNWIRPCKQAAVEVQSVSAVPVVALLEETASADAELETVAVAVAVAVTVDASTMTADVSTQAEKAEEADEAKKSVEQKKKATSFLELLAQEDSVASRTSSVDSVAKIAASSAKVAAWLGVDTGSEQDGLTESETQQGGKVGAEVRSGWCSLSRSCSSRSACLIHLSSDSYSSSAGSLCSSPTGLAKEVAGLKRGIGRGVSSTGKGCGISTLCSSSSADHSGLTPAGLPLAAENNSVKRGIIKGVSSSGKGWRTEVKGTTLAALGFAPSSTDTPLFLRTNTTLPPLYVLVYVDNLVFTTADTEALALVKAELLERHTCTDLGELRSYLGLQITRDRAWRTITLTQSHMVHQVLQRFGFQFSSPQPTPQSTGHSLSAPPSDESVEPSGPYTELRLNEKRSPLHSASRTTTASSSTPSASTSSSRVSSSSASSSSASSSSASSSYASSSRVSSSSSSSSSASSASVSSSTVSSSSASSSSASSVSASSSSASSPRVSSSSSLTPAPVPPAPGSPAPGSPAPTPPTPPATAAPVPLVRAPPGPAAPAPPVTPRLKAPAPPAPRPQAAEPPAPAAPFRRRVR
ncbi:unnamed protein product, partial [Closterium sp. NIES-54]